MTIKKTKKKKSEEIESRMSLRIPPELRTEFHVAVRLEGHRSAAAALHFFIVQTIREAKKNAGPEKWDEALKRYKTEQMIEESEEVDVENLPPGYSENLKIRELPDPDKKDEN